MYAIGLVDINYSQTVSKISLQKQRHHDEQGKKWSVRNPHHPKERHHKDCMRDHAQGRRQPQEQNWGDIHNPEVNPLR
jgi:hypothetical protein